MSRDGEARVDGYGRVGWRLGHQSVGICHGRVLDDALAAGAICSSAGAWCEEMDEMLRLSVWTES